MSAPIPPVRRSIRVSWRPEQAFERFTAQFGAWWPYRTHSVGGDSVARVVFEPRLGGLIYEEHKDGRRFQWGEVTIWEPPRRLGFTFHPSRDRAEAQDVVITFESDGDGANVILTATGWERFGAKARRARDSYNVGWGYVLDIWAQRRSAKTTLLDMLMALATGLHRLGGKSAEDDIAEAKGEIAPAREADAR